MSGSTRAGMCALSLAVLLAAGCGGGGGGGSSSDSESSAPAPDAAFVADKYVNEGVFTVNFDASASASRTRAIGSYAWSFGDGDTGSGAQVSHTYATAGTYRVTLTVTDSNGQSASTVGVITVLANGADDLFPDQWHLVNTGQSGNGGATATADEDINVDPVWASCADASCRGEGVRVAVVDDGLEIAHEDLSANVVNFASHNYVTGGTDPTPSDGGDAHGTAVAGLVAARDNNSLGTRGVAPRAELVGYNLLQSFTSSNMADAMTRDAANVDISTNSWGAPDGYGVLQDPGATWRDAIVTGLSNGRGGLGTVYTWAAGNGAPTDNSNYDGQANFYGVMAVGALNAQGKKSSYSEQGANLWVSAPGGESCASLAITTTDLMSSRGFNSGGNANDLTGATNYTQCMNGTSSATPIVAGVAALVLQANPALSWRDVKLVLAKSARQNDAGDGGWTTNGAGISINHKYGFGAVDADAAVALAKTWTLLPAMKTYSSATRSPGTSIPDNNATGITDTLTIAGSGIANIEYVEIYVTASHGYAGDLEIDLIHTGGATSRLSEAHGCAGDACVPMSNWRFGSARHLDESADGEWKLVVRDRQAADSGTLQSWRLVFHGH